MFAFSGAKSSVNLGYFECVARKRFVFTLFQRLNVCCFSQTFLSSPTAPAGCSGTLRRLCWPDNDEPCCCAACWNAAAMQTLSALGRGWIPSAHTHIHTHRGQELSQCEQSILSILSYNRWIIFVSICKYFCRG